MYLQRDNKVRTILLIVGMALLVHLAGSSPANACGTLQGLSDKYWDSRTSDRVRGNILKALSDVCGDYKAYDSDATLMAIFRDALSKGYDRATIRKGFETYWCLAGSRNQPGYAGLVEALNKPTCPTEAVIANWYVVSVSGANMRSGPDKKSMRTGVALRGTLVERLESRGAWFRVRRMSNETGYIHASLLSRFKQANR